VESPPASSPLPTVTPAPRTEAALRRDVGLAVGVALVVNATIGTGIFKTPAKVARLSGSLSASFAVWIVGAVVALAGAITLAELAAAVPRTGGIYEYLRRSFGPSVAFLFAWTKLVLLIPSAVGSFARLAAEATAALLGLAPDATRDTRVALAFLVVAAGANLAGVRTSALQQAALTAAKYGGVALLAVLGLAAALPSSGVPVPAEPPPFADAPTFAGCFAALVSVMWAYDGWADLSSLAGEVRDPGRSLPRALVAGTVAIALVYLAANAGYARVLGLEGLRRSTTGSNMVAANLAALTLGDLGRRLLSALLLVSCLGGAMSSLLTGSRVFVPLATDGHVLGWLGALSPRTAVPTRAVLVSAVLGGVYVTVRSFEQLTEAFVVGYFPFYVLAVVAVFRLRAKEPDLPRPFRVPLWPLPPIVFLAGAIVLLVGAAGDVDRNGLVAFAVMLTGLPVAWVHAARARRRASQARSPIRTQPQCRPPTRIGADTSFISIIAPPPRSRRYVWTRKRRVFCAAARATRSRKTRRFRQFAAFHTGSGPCGWETFRLCVGT
jgi:amino acid transporter